MSIRGWRLGWRGLVMAMVLVLGPAVLLVREFRGRDSGRTPMLAADPGVSAGAAEAGNNGKLAEIRASQPGFPAHLSLRYPVDVKEGRVFDDYAGSMTCRECHPGPFSSWQSSNHGLAERQVLPADRALLARSVSMEGAQAGTNKVSGTLARRMAEMDGHVPLRVIGRSPLWQFLVETEPGRVQAWDVAHDPHRGDWFSIFGDEERQQGEWGHWTGRGMNWNSMCASCHNTRLRKNYDPVEDIYRTEMAEVGVGCEACHGPMQAHVDWQWAARETGEPPVEDPHLPRWTGDLKMAICGSCHSRRHELTGDFVPGDRYEDHFLLTRVDGTDIYHADGQVRDENYEYGSFLSSRMHAAGVKCGDCHDPHSGKTLRPGNALCMDCHSGARMNAPRIIPAAHSRHPVGSTGAQCVACHMPVTTYMQRHDRHDHGFTVPDPLLTLELGIPNACNRCHQDQDAEWSLRHVEEWYGDRMDRPQRDRARLVSAFRTGAPDMARRLIDRFQGETHPYWRAVWMGLMTDMSADPAMGPHLTRAARDPDTGVRVAAVEGLGRRWVAGDLEAEGTLRILLKDPARQVRIRTAWMLRSDPDALKAVGTEFESWLALHADQPTGRMQWGMVMWDQGAREPTLRRPAIERFRRATEWDPGSAMIWHEYGMVLSMAGSAQAARRAMEKAVELEPHVGEFWYKLGLAWNEVGKTREAADALAVAVQKDPGHGRAWYNLGLARNQLGDVQGAIRSLERSVAVDLSDGSAAYALATIHLAGGDINNARAAAAEALRRMPGDPRVRRLAQQLDRLP